jgi:hypothetical protein
MRGANAAAAMMQQSLAIDEEFRKDQTAVEEMMKKDAYQTPEEAMIQLKREMKNEVDQLIERRFAPIEDWVRDVTTMTRNSAKNGYAAQPFKIKPIDVKSSGYGARKEAPKTHGFQPTDDALEHAVEDISEKVINAAPVRRNSITSSAKFGGVARGHVHLPAFMSKVSPTHQQDELPPGPVAGGEGHKRGRRLSTLLEMNGTVLQEEQFPDFFLHPNSTFLTYWNAFLMMAVIYISIALPLRMGFTLNSSRGEDVLDVLLDIFFLFDMVMNFRTGYIDANTKIVVVSPKQVAIKYLKGWFFLDLFSSLPVSLITIFEKSLEDLVIVKLFRFLKIFRISRLMRLDFIRELEYKGILAPSFIRMMKFLVIFLFNLHLITCFFWMMFGKGETTYIVGDGEGEFTEGDSSEMTFKGGLEDGTGNWGDIPHSSIEADLSTRYFYGLYWSLVVSLGNDFGPEDMSQRLYSTLILIAGIFLYAIIVGSASSLMTNLDHNAAMKKRQMDDINYYMMFHKVPGDLQNKVRAYYEYQWSQGIGVQEEKILFRQLSQKWQTRLQMAVKAKFIQMVPMFKEIQQPCVESLVVMLKAIITLPMEAVITQGTEG